VCLTSSEGILVELTPLANKVEDTEDSKLKDGRR